MNKKLKIFDVTGPTFMAELKKTALPFEGNIGPFSSTITALLAPPWNARTVIFEYDYVDRDYQDEFSAFYSKAFKQYPSRCVRLHFFSCAIPARTRINFGRYRDHYVGFIVLRPTDLQRMGRTVLVPPITDSDHEFIHCCAAFSAHLFGDCFKIHAMPFVQQDTQVGACAQASLWVVARYMAQRFGHREFLPSEVNHLAKSKNAHGRALPAEFGLNLYQMLDALEGMGFFAWSYANYGLGDCSKHIEAAFPVDPSGTRQQQEAEYLLQISAKLADITYRYIESGLPVILATNDHALVAIGHTYDPSAAGTVAIQRIPDWIVHNDNTGPYIRMPLLRDVPGTLSFLNVRSIIAVAPREVTLRGEEAEAMTMFCVDELLAQPTMDPTLPTWRDLFKLLRPEIADCLGQLEYRTFLIPSVEFQTRLKQDIKAGRFDKKLGEKILQMDFPRFIWITEISSRRLLNHNNREDRCCLGRVILDSTAPAKTHGQMVVHFCDFVQLIDRQTPSKVHQEFFHHTTPFGHKIVS
jgi:hypothetical protein